VSPSLWWNKQSLLAMAKQHTMQYQHKVYIAVGGKEHKVMRKDAKELKAIIEQEMNKRSALKFEKMAKESHLTILHNAAYNALVWLNTVNETHKTELKQK
jgi:predicted alpha/beta superfamily hydrolase